MGEKEIKPAGASGGGPQVSTPPPGPGGSGTQEKPGTGGPVTPPKPEAPKPRPAGGGGGGGGSTSGSGVWDDGYKIDQDPGGAITLSNPDGTTATWDREGQAWTGADGKAMPEGWSGGHRAGL